MPMGENRSTISLDRQHEREPIELFVHLSDTKNIEEHDQSIVQPDSVTPFSPIGV